MERGGSALEGRGVELEGAEAAAEELVVLEREHGMLQLGVVLQEGGLELLVLDLRLVERGDRARRPRRG